MKRILTLSVSLFSGSAIAQDPELPKSKPQMPTTYWAQKPVQCSNMETLIEMTKKYGEVPTIIMDDQTGFPNGITTPSKFVIALNPTTETWTLIEFVSDEQSSCFGFWKRKYCIGTTSR